MRLAVRWLALLAVLGSACARPGQPSGSASGGSASAEYQRLQELAFGFGAVTSLLVDCVESADAAIGLASGKPATTIALQDLRALLDEAGRTLAEHADDPPPPEENERAEVRGALDRALEALEDAAANLEEARNQLLDLQEVAPPSLSDALEDLRQRIEGCLTELTDLRDQIQPASEAAAE